MTRAAIRLGIVKQRILAAVLCAAAGVAWCAEQDVVVLYPAYAVAGTGIVEGRVLEHEESQAAAATDRRRDNLRRNLGLMVNSELEGQQIKVRAAGKDWSATSDAEGYFRIELKDLGELAGGWHSITAHCGQASGTSGLLVVPPQNIYGLISDFDDTVVISEVNDTRRLLANTFLKNALQREAVPGAAQLYHKLVARNPDPAAAPLFYLSASPRQLSAPVQAFLEHNRFPRGVVITKRVTNDASSEPLRDQFAYKIARIEDILARVPHVRFTLMGDDGEQDPEIYDEIRRRHPQRIEAIWIRRVHPDPNRAKLPQQGDMGELLAKKT